MTLKKVVGVVGMPGSGKSVADEVAREMGFSIVIMGDVIRDEVTKRGLAPTPENVGKVMVKIRREEGPAVVATRCISKIQNTLKREVIVEGLRSLDEIYEFRRNFSNFKIIAIHVSPEIRFHRVFGRNRSDDSTDWNTFLTRDLREIEVGIGSAIALADYMIINESSLQSFRVNIRKCLRTVLSE